MTKGLNIVIVNAHWNNRGDEAAHCALWEKLASKYPTAKLTVMFKDRKQITWFPKHIDADYFSCQFKATEVEIWRAIASNGEIATDPLLKKAVHTIREADLILYSPGGSVINDRFYWSKQLEFLLPFFCASIYRIPIFVCAPSIGPFRHSRPIRQHLLKEATKIFVREEISRQSLNKIGVSKNVDVGIDLAFMSEIDNVKAGAELKKDRKLHDFLLTGQAKTIGMTISDFKWHVKFGKNQALQKNIMDSCLEFINHLSQQNYKVLLIPQLFGNQNDTELLKQFVTNERVFLMDESHDANFQQFVISHLFAVMGMRYHCNIFAAKTGTPFVAMSYEEKMDGFLDRAGLRHYSLPITEISLPSLVQKLKLVEENHSQIRKLLNHKLPDWKRSADSVFHELDNVIQKIDPKE